MKTEIGIIENIEERNVLAEHLEVLEQVKELLLLPGTDCMTAKQVAEFYEVGIKAIQTLYEVHRNELELDGAQLVRQSAVLNLCNGDLKKVERKDYCNSQSRWKDI